MCCGLASCGGGGGGSSAPNLQFAPGAAAINSYSQASHSYSMNTSYNGHNWSLTLSDTPSGTTTTFLSQSAYYTTDSLNLYEDGVLVVNSISTTYYTLNPYTELGGVDSSGTPFIVVTSSSAIPSTINVGDSGPIESGIYYHDSNQNVTDANFTTTYTVAGYSPSAVKFCSNIVISGVTAQGTTDGLINSTETDCYSVTSSGTANLISITLNIGGSVLTFK